ncbi:hypothetical protein HYPSUDRAFT_199039 [Hypholoma sublateritium FD-334 SS-4]|uniref:Uncharacterized protein n=1 Tax=Hypholoma sublateritium (strain FD-334 SS-4) TaxID=945553 RepID=A0A0D2LFB3_HYPSF|nr:hypothetical protein HYPSUDRAFT_199039 [Hypholoma sublateritium FD-334 SS-4]
MGLLLSPTSSPFSASQPITTAPVAAPILLNHSLKHNLKVLQIRRPRHDDAAQLHPACAGDARSQDSESPYEESSRVRNLNALRDRAAPGGGRESTPRPRAAANSRRDCEARNRRLRDPGVMRELEDGCSDRVQTRLAGPYGGPWRRHKASIDPLFVPPPATDPPPSATSRLPPLTTLRLTGGAAIRCHYVRLGVVLPHLSTSDDNAKR